MRDSNPENVFFAKFSSIGSTKNLMWDGKHADKSFIEMVYQFFLVNSSNTDTMSIHDSS